MRLLHVVTGLLALLSGVVALYALEGGTLHRRSGTVFVHAMLVMSGTGALLAALKTHEPGSVIAGLLTLYLVRVRIRSPPVATSTERVVGSLRLEV